MLRYVVLSGGHVLPLHFVKHYVTLYMYVTVCYAVLRLIMFILGMGIERSSGVELERVSDYRR